MEHNQCPREWDVRGEDRDTSVDKQQLLTGPIGWSIVYSQDI
jgi:hypothetical protein